MPGSVAEAQKRLDDMGVLGADVEGEAMLRLKSGGQLRAVWAVVAGGWLHYVDEDGQLHSTSAENVADVQWDSS